MNDYATQFPDAMTPQNSRELAEQRLAAEQDRQRKSDAAREHSFAEARVARERQDRLDKERERVLAPWQKAHDDLQVLVRRAADQCLKAEAKSVRYPLDVGLATDALGAERCLIRLQLKLDEHEQAKPA